MSIMKKIVLMCLAAILAISAGAQVQQPTVLYLNVTVSKQAIVAGPYARYAQKYLGVSVPLADKAVYEVKEVKLLDNSDVKYYLHEFHDNKAPLHMSPEGAFPRLTIDKTSAASHGLEESARLAAEKIFALRKSRLDLITGEIGENVFGGGLDAALKEIARLEEEYLSLFLGKESTGEEFRQYRVTPVKDRYTYTVCRFSDADGLLPESDLSGVPMVLELRESEDSMIKTPATLPKASTRTVSTLIPADMQCRVVLDGVELASERFLIGQMGETVNAIK
jgi:hypothetical protein